MRKHISAIIAILTAAAVITGCQTKDNAPSSDGTESTASESTTASTTSNAPTAEAETPAAATAEAETPVVVVTAEPEAPTAEVSAPETEAVTSIKPGTWRGTDSYFFFYEDGKGGSTLDFDYGMGLGFEYDLTEDGHLIFHMGSADSDLSTSYVLDGDTLYLTKDDDGSTDTLVYVSESPNLKFYTNQELANIAQYYYMANNDGYVPEASGIQTNDDGTVTIQLYDQLEDHNSTAAWYTIDRVTLLGIDEITQTQIDFSEYATADAAVG